jgi:hypothetical protein
MNTNYASALVDNNKSPCVRNEYKIGIANPILALVESEIDSLFSL